MRADLRFGNISGDAHPVANTFPAMSEAEYAALKADIAEHGVREPVCVVLSPPPKHGEHKCYDEGCFTEASEHCDLSAGDGVWTCSHCGHNPALLEYLILDGRHRWRACQELGIDCPTDEYDGEEGGLVAFVVSLNLHRRHLSESQRAMVAASIANIPHGVVGGGHDRQSGNSAGLVSQPEAASLLNVSERLVRDAKAVKDDGSLELVNAVQSGAVSVSAAAEIADLPHEEQRAVVAKGEGEILRAAKDIKKRKAEARVKKRKQDAEAALKESHPLNGKAYVLHHGDCSKMAAKIRPGSIDAIITDPPYPLEFIERFSALSQVAARVLKPGGHCLVMCGQSHLQEVMRRVSERLDYQWTLAYLTPGQSTQIFGRRIKSNWKPVLWLTNGPHEWEHVPDFVSSDMNDKRFHEWGQSVGGMAQIVERFTVAGQVVLDPFCGASSTGVAALECSRIYIGIDIDAEAVALSAKRLSELSQSKAA